MLQIIHLTDTHIKGKKGKEAKNLNVIVKDIQKRYSNSKSKTVVLLTGDIVDDGRKHQYKIAREILSPLFHNDNFLVWATPGNHDYGWQGTFADSSKFKYFKTYLYGGYENVTYPHVKYTGTRNLDVRQYDGHIFIGLNSMKAELGDEPTKKEESEFLEELLADGDLGQRQLEDLNGILNTWDNRNREKSKVILHLHHHPFIFPDRKDSIIAKSYEKKCHQLKDWDKLQLVIKGRVDILLFGHDHEHLDFSDTTISGENDWDIPVILSGGKCTSSRMKEYKLDKDGRKTKQVLNRGLMGSLINIDNLGKISKSTIVFGEK